jgi:hypothetical protein
MKIQKFFRYLWRIDAILILLATGTITVAVGALLLQEFAGRVANRRNAEAGVPVGAGPRLDLTLGHAEAVSGSTTLRADLFASKEGGGLSSGSYSETRNILFIYPGQTAAHWLLGDNDHVITKRFDVKDDKDPMRERVIATAILVKPQTEQSETATGKLLLLDAAGKNTVEIAKDVRDVHVATLSAGALTLLYERNRRLVFATYEPVSLANKGEQEVEVPQLK